MSKVGDTERRLARRQAVDAAYQALEKYQVNRRRITFLPDDYKRAGGYGIVRKAHLHPSAYLPVWLASRHYDPPQLVAVKQIKISAADDISDVKGAFTKEMLVWSSLEAHDGIAKFTGFYADFNLQEAWLISPWEPNGNVSEFIRQHKLEVPEKLSLIYDTIDALIFLHQLNPPVCHGDVKSANVLISSKFRAVLCDFGLARLYEDSGFGRLETSTGFKGSIRWCSPELINGHPRTPSSDVYAWGWLAWEIMTGELPYEGTSADYAIILKIFEGPQPHVDGEFRLSDCLQVWDLITRCWAAVPEQRPTSSMCRTAITSLPRCPPVLGDQARSAKLLENLGDLESWKGNYEEGFAYLEQALLLYEQEENNRGIASVLCKQAAVSYRHAYPGKALKAASAALDKLRTLNDPLGTAETLFLMGSSLGMQSKNDDAMAFLEEALEIFRAHSNDVGIVQCLERIGEVHRRRGDFEEALSVLEEAVAIAGACGDKLGEAKVLTLLGWVNWGQNNVEEAISFVSEACDIARRIGWAHGICTALWRLGIIQERQGNPTEAEMLFQESISISRQSNARWRLAQGLWELGYCLRGQNRLDEAAKALEESCSIYQDISHGDWEFPYTAALLAGVKRDQGATTASLYWYDVSIAEYRKIPDKPKLSGVLADKGTVLEDTETYDEAVLHFEASMVIDMELEDDHGVRWNRRRLSKIPKTAIRWESRKFTKARAVEVQRGLPLLCDVKKLQRRIPYLRTSSLKLEIQVKEMGNP